MENPLSPPFVNGEKKGDFTFHFSIISLVSFSEPCIVFFLFFEHNFSILKKVQMAKINRI